MTITIVIKKVVVIVFRSAYLRLIAVKVMVAYVSTANISETRARCISPFVNADNTLYFPVHAIQLLVGKECTLSVGSVPCLWGVYPVGKECTLSVRSVPCLWGVYPVGKE